jgi:hypothetical protein
VQSRIIPDRFVEEDDVVAALRRTEVRQIEAGEIAREFESAAVLWFRDVRVRTDEPPVIDDQRARSPPSAHSQRVKTSGPGDSARTRMARR